MLLSRFWYVLLGLVIGALVFVLFLAQSMFNRANAREVAQGLQSDSQVVSWYLQNDARERAAHLIQFALNDQVAKHLAKSSNSDKAVPRKSRGEVREGLEKVASKIPEEQGFDAVFAVDQHGRVVAHLGYDQAAGMENFELGGYPVVADALHGYIRDDTLVLDRLYRVVARPVEFNVGQMPAGAIVGARIIDDRFARELSRRTGAAVAFYSKGQRGATGAPEGFDKSQLDLIVNDLEEVQARDEDYKEKGRSQVRSLSPEVKAVYARLPGEAWALGAGYVVGRDAMKIESPLAFFTEADDKDKARANILLVVLIVLAGIGFGMLFSVLEHSRPLSLFKNEARRLSKGEADQLQPSKFRGVLRTIASDINDGIDAAVGKAGGTRRAADFKQVLGDIPDQPQMSAFSLPGEETAPEPAAGPPGGAAAPAPNAAPGPPSRPKGPLPKPPGSAPGKPAPPSAPGAPPASAPKAPPASAPKAPPASAPGANGAPESGEDPEWRRVYDEFVATKQQCGENVDGFTFEKFKHTLRKNRDAIIQRHGVKRVKFSVYVKEGKAALKASPIKE